MQTEARLSEVRSNPSASANGDASPALSFIEALPDPCIVVDSTNRAVAVNSAWREFARENGTPGAAAHPVGTDYFALFLHLPVNEAFDNMRAGIGDVLEGKRETYEQEHICSTGKTLRWFRMTARRLRESGRGQALILHREITSEKLARASLQLLDEEFRALADSSPVLIWMSGPDRECTFFNRRWLEFTGVPVEQQIGDGWLEVVHPDDRERVLKEYHLAFDQQQEFELEYRVRYKDGSYRWIRDRGLPRFDPRYRLKGFVGSAWDLTEERRATAAADRASRVTRLVRDVAVIANSAGTMREALQSSLDVICETLDFAVGHALLIHDDEPELAKPIHVAYTTDRARFAALLEISSRIKWERGMGAPGEVLRTAKPVLLDPVEAAKRPDLYPRAQVAAGAGMRAAFHVPVVVDGKVEAILEFATEQTVEAVIGLMDALVAGCEQLSRFFERRRAQVRFLKQKEELQDSTARLFAMAGRLVNAQEAERHRIAREIHDDFTQRLAMVTLKISSLASGGTAAKDGDVKADLEDVRESIASVAADLRDLSHQLRPATLEILGLISALRSQCDEFQRLRGVETRFESNASDRDASPETAICLYRVLQEGLQNIARHSGGRKAWVTLSRTLDHLEMRIRDEGMGFVSSNSESGGIGLMNIEDRMRLLGGELSVFSRPGAGTELVVRVPAPVAARRQVS